MRLKKPSVPLPTSLDIHTAQCYVAHSNKNIPGLRDVDTGNRTSLNQAQNNPGFRA